jgi:ribose 5-phosphate isomerase B
MKAKTIYLAADHAGYKLKEAIKAFLAKAGHKVIDLGTDSTADCDYPDFIIPAAEAVVRSKGRAVGIIFGGSGIGECLAAAKVMGARPALAYDTYTAKKSRQHNDANLLCLGGRTITKDAKLAKRLVRTWLATPFSRAARHGRRLKKIAAYERCPKCVKRRRK